MKRIYLLIYIVCTITLFGCSTNNEPTNPVSLTPPDVPNRIIKLDKSKLISVEYPKGYIAKQSGDMLIVSNKKGKIIIGGFIPADGYPEANKKDFPFRLITYTKDKIEAWAIPAALFYRYGDKKTETELIEILNKVGNL